ncbi:hypothetical protein IWQ60_003114 [Tieghemiomyces parasiticus]|uniref:Uncharacterized protein n=1 Tax=Tieghemiomyces parasiticus TaxID=78921 RepID=A0A9W8ADW5_9FUNG|nr:hypothetical protein IWQ60_003114 [Tieghemiomyces parasiticus]
MNSSSNGLPSTTGNAAADNAWETVRELIHKRIVTFIHLRRVVSSNPSLFFNCITIPPSELTAFYNSVRMRQRTHQYLTLGLSLGPILDISNPHDFLKALGSLMQEYQDYTAEAEKQKKKTFFRKSRGAEEALLSASSAGGMAQAAPAAGNGGGVGSYVGSSLGLTSSQYGGPGVSNASSTTVASTMTAVVNNGPGGGSGGMMATSSTTLGATNIGSGGNSGGGGSGGAGFLPEGMQFNHLEARNFPFDMDFLHTFDTLCEVICLVYNRLSDMVSLVSQNQGLQDTLTKIDARFKKIIQTMLKELDELAKQTIQDEFAALSLCNTGKGGVLLGANSVPIWDSDI